MRVLYSASDAYPLVKVKGYSIPAMTFFIMTEVGVSYLEFVAIVRMLTEHWQSHARFDRKLFFQRSIQVRSTPVLK
jgi:hypothetical protein